MNDYSYHILAGITVMLAGQIGLSIYRMIVDHINFKHLKTKVDKHEDNFGRVAWRDECDGKRQTCGNRINERHQELKEKIDKLDGRLDKFDTKLESCMADLIDALQGRNDVS
jgi:hypothetical protein